MRKLTNQAITHGGKFHADDVFSAALLKIINPEIQIIRTFQAPESFDGIVFDIGLGEFDHHQENSDIRENGVPYAAFGLLWREFGESVLMRYGCREEQAAGEARRMDEKFIQPLDEDDNTGRGNPVAAIIGTFNPSWDSEESAERCFEEAVEFAVVILQKRIDSVTSIQRATTLVEAALEASENNIVVLPKFAPWKMTLAGSAAEFVAYPSQRGGYSAQVVPLDESTNEPKIYFPEEWAGKPENELKRISGISTLKFCHKGRFLISTDNLEDIVAACRLAQNETAKMI